MSTTQGIASSQRDYSKPRSNALMVVPIAITLISALGYYIYYENFATSISEFQSKFSELEKGGSQIPNVTSITLLIAPYFGLLFLISLVPCVLSIVKHKSTKTKHKLLWLYNGIGAVIPYLLPLWLIFVTYLPVLNMEAH